MPDSNATPTGDLIIRSSHARRQQRGRRHLRRLGHVADGPRGRRAGRRARPGARGHGGRPVPRLPQAVKIATRSASMPASTRWGAAPSPCMSSLARRYLSQRRELVTEAASSWRRSTPRAIRRRCRPNSTDETQKRRTPPGNRRALAPSNLEGRAGLRRKALSWPEPAAGSAHQRPAAGHPVPRRAVPRGRRAAAERASPGFPGRHARRGRHRPCRGRTR